MPRRQSLSAEVRSETDRAFNRSTTAPGLLAEGEEGSGDERVGLLNLRKRLREFGQREQESLQPQGRQQGRASIAGS
jgi:hypothetical protein